MSLDCFSTQLQIIPYTRPPKPKPTLQRKFSRTPFKGPEVLILDEVVSIGLAPVSHQAGDVKSTSTSEDTCKLEDSGTRRGDRICTGGFPTSDKQGVEVEHLVSRGDSAESLSESSGQPVLSKGDRSECAIVIVDDQPESDADNHEGYSPDLDSGTQDHGSFGDANFFTKDYYKTEGIEDARNSGPVDRPESQDSGLRSRELSSAPSTSSTGLLIVTMEQQVNSDTLSENHVNIHQQQGPLNREAKEQGTLTHLGSTSRHSRDGSDDATDHDTVNYRNLLTRKRKHSPPGNWHRRVSTMASEQPVLGNQNCSINSIICYSDDNSDSCSESSSPSRHLKSNKRRKSASQPCRSRSHSGAEEDDEYEVEQILKARIHLRKLQYHVKWLDYEDDPTWYDASNFKNSPHKLCEFHTANTTSPGPPQRLKVWLRCWEEGRDAVDHSEDDKPQRSYTGRRT